MQHPGAERGRELDRERADAAGAAVHQERFAGCRPAIMNTFDQTVHATSGSAAASRGRRRSGTGSSWPAGTATRSAYPPPASSAQTSSPTCQPVTPSPTAATVPLHSRPRTSEAPGGGG